MIFTDRKITIRNGKSSINEPVILYRGDFEVSIKFTIMESKFRFKSGVNLVDSEKASFGQLAILAPYGGNVFSEIVKCEDGTVTFTLTKEMIDQLEEVGLYSFQIRLFDYYRESRVSIPPVEFGIEVREPVASEDHGNEVNNAIVGYSIAKVVDGLNENVPDTFDSNGQYNKTDWKTGDRISQGKLNKIEDALDQINQNEKNDVIALDKRVSNNFNVLSSELNTKVNYNDKISINMIDKNKGKIDQTYLSDELIDQIAGDAAVNAIPADNSITNNKLTINCVQAFNTTFIEGHAGEWIDGYSIASFGSEEPLTPNSNGTVLHMVDVGTALGKWRFVQIERAAFLDSSGNVLGVFSTGLDHTITIDETNTNYYNLFKNATYMSVSTPITRKSGVHVYHNDEEIQLGYTIKYLDLNERQLEQCDVNTANFLEDKLGYRAIGENALGYWYSPTANTILSENAEYFTTNSLDVKYGDTIQIPLIPNMHHRINIFDKDDNILGGWTINSVSTVSSVSINHELFKNCTYIRVSAPIVGIDQFYVKINGIDVFEREPLFSFDRMISTFNEDIVDYMTANLGYRTATKNHIGYCYPSNSLDVMVPFETYFTTSFIPATYGDTVKVPYSTYYVRINVFDHGQNYLGGATFNSGTTAAGEDHTLEITHTIFEQCGYITVSERLAQYSGYYVLVNGEDRFDSTEYFVFDKMLDNNNGDSGNSGNNIIEPGDITSVLSRGGYIKLGEGIYTSKNVTLPANTILEGIGDNTIIKFDDSCTGYMLTLSNGCKINNIVLDGGNTAQPSYTDIIGDRNGIRINNVVRCRLHEVRVTGFSGNGLRATTIGANQEHHKNLKISNCDFEFNYIGILFDTRAEYIQTINTACGNNFWGCVNRGGNNLFSNCMFNSNYNGFMVEGGSEYPNHGHSSSSNCSYNHNNNIAIQALNVSIGYIFNGCQMFDGDLIIENSTGIWFCNGEMGSHSIKINSGGFNLIKDNFFYTKPTVTITESNSLLKDNYYADGTSFTNN